MGDTPKLPPYGAGGCTVSYLLMGRLSGPSHPKR